MRNAGQQLSVNGAFREKLLVASFFAAARRGFVLTALVTLTACGGGGNEAPSQAQTTPSAPTAMSAASVRAVDLTDIEIAQMLYSDHQRTPFGFSTDVAPGYPGYVATSHLKNTDLTGSTTSAQYELCADDWTVALAWSDQAAAAMSASTLVETNVTSRYHEFIRLRAGSPQGYLRTRVYRCSYLDRSSTDLRTESSTAGQVNQRPFDASALRQLAEYLWQFTTYNNYGNAVLKSDGASTNSGLQHTLVIASLGGTANGCDRINVVAWTHSANSQTGALVRTKQTLWEFGAKRSAGLVELCNPF